MPVPSINNEWQTSLASTWTRQHARGRARHRACVAARRWCARSGPTARRRPGSRSTSRVRSAGPQQRLARTATRPAAIARMLAEYLKPTDLMPTDGIVRADRGEAIAGTRERRRQGARALRLGRRQHVSRAEGARLRRRRHQGDARDRQHGRQVRRHQRAVRRAVRARPAFRRATSTAFASPTRRSATRSSAPERRTSRARSTAAPKCGSPATAGSRWTRPTSARSCASRPPNGSRTRSTRSSRR